MPVFMVSLKPSWGEVFSDTINTGIYILEKKALDYIPTDKEFDFSKDLFPLMLEKKEPLFGYIAEGYWKDVGSLEEYRAANMDILQGNVHVEIPGDRIEGRRLWVGKGSRIAFTAKLEGAIVIGGNCRIEADARISNSIIGPNSVVEEGAVIRDSVLWDSTRVARGTSLHEDVVGGSSEILDQAHIAEGVIVSDHCRIGRNATLKANVKVWPYKIVEDDATLASSLIWGEKWSRNIFSTYGVTGLANIELSPEFAAKLGAAYGASLKKGSVVSTSRDAHKTSRMINRAIMTGILSTGVSVHDYGVTPMPVVRFLARSGTEAGGIHTRRSPFDTQLLDLKFFDSKGLDLHPGYEKTVEKLFFKEDFPRVTMEETGEMSFPIHAFESYQDAFMSMVDAATVSKARFKFVVDYSYGSSSRIFPSILGKLNCEVIALNAYLDAGGEKVFLFDETGEALDGDTALNIVTLLVLKTSKEAGRIGHIAVPITASRAIDRMAEMYGFTVKRTKTTPRGQMEAAAAGAVFVGEQSGGYMFPAFQPNFDGMYAVAKILEMLAKHGARLHKLMREIPPSIIVKERVSCSFENKGMIMRRLAEDSRGLETVLLDGIKIKFGEDWIVAYPSQDMPYFMLVAEASTEEAARSLVNRYSRKIREWQRS